jgi:hypothetical protein
MEHRWGERVGVDFAVRISALPFVVRHGRLTNLSVSGASITAAFDFRLLSRIQIFFDLPHRTRSESPAIAAYVTRVSKGGAGIEWCEFAPPAVTELLQSAAARRYARRRKSEAASIAISRLYAPLLKHSS